jgi:hypothetical protein
MHEFAIMNTILKSPVTGNPMSHVILDDGLDAWHCVDSGGHYIPAVCYMRWLEKQPARLPQVPASTNTAPAADDPESARMCPETGTIMTRCRVGHGFGFSVDRSITGGIWLDGGEWEALQARNFHDELHLVFTSPWQKRVRDERAQAAYEARLVETLGADLCDRLRALRTELADHPDRSMALAFLTHD